MVLVQEQDLRMLLLVTTARDIAPAVMQHSELVLLAPQG
jgi:hypothetical protein